MSILLKKSEPLDIPFMKDMLFEAVFWRAIENGDAPDPYTALLDPTISKSIDQWGEKPGDLAVIAYKNAAPIGAAWLRYWTDDENIRGYIKPDIPVLVIGVSGNNRGQGIGYQMMQWLIDQAPFIAIKQISLMVAKDNDARYLYEKCGFQIYSDTGDSVLMLLTL